MTNWKTPPQDEERPVAALWEKLERVEGLALRVVEDEVGDAGFGLLAVIVGWIVVLHRRVVSAERWNRRETRKREMLGSEALRMNVCDRLGGVGALERWEERARLALSYGRQADGSRLRGNDEGGGLGGGNSNASSQPTDTPQRTYTTQPKRTTTHTTQHAHTSHHTPSSPRRRGSPSGSPEFALARMPGAGTRRATTRIVRAAPRHETPIPIWPCEVMPDLFKKEWWKAEPSETQGKDTKFPEGRQAYPGSPSVKGYSADDGGPASSAGTIARAAS